MSFFLKKILLAKEAEIALMSEVTRRPMAAENRSRLLTEVTLQLTAGMLLNKSKILSVQDLVEFGGVDLGDLGSLVVIELAELDDQGDHFRGNVQNGHLE